LSYLVLDPDVTCFFDDGSVNEIVFAHEDAGLGGDWIMNDNGGFLNWGSPKWMVYNGNGKCN
jgi:hypothetical protein